MHWNAVGKLVHFYFYIYAFSVYNKKKYFPFLMLPKRLVIPDSIENIRMCNKQTLSILENLNR